MVTYLKKKLIIDEFIVVYQ